MLRVNTEEVKCEWHTRENLCVSAQTDKMWSKKKLKSQNIFFVWFLLFLCWKQMLKSIFTICHTAVQER